MVAITNISLSPETEILVNDDVYYSKLGKVLLSTPKRVFGNYIAWRLIEYFGKYSSESLRNCRFQFEKITSGLKGISNRWEFCFDLLASKLPHLIGRLYVDNYFNEMAKKDVQNLVFEIKKQLRLKIANSVWIDEKTRFQALSKLNYDFSIQTNENSQLHQMLAVVGYQSWIKNDTQLEAYYFELDQIRSSNFLDAVLEMDRANTLREFRKLQQLSARETK
ncbi:neprilysin-like protein [Dinothrombium tinctorium]|uniref:Neprilysin-like protein n=1 Tax=Dinothrombium tinctorium TaxID=1965070 RepID=A0A443QVR7_9ACAR|nr:neprilysin-like protein [Dinothrombium tinctorium]